MFTRSTDNLSIIIQDGNLRPTMDNMASAHVVPIAGSLNKAAATSEMNEVAEKELCQRQEKVRSGQVLFCLASGSETVFRSVSLNL